MKKKVIHMNRIYKLMMFYSKIIEDNKKKIILLLIKTLISSENSISSKLYKHISMQQYDKNRDIFYNKFLKYYLFIL